MNQPRRNVFNLDLKREIVAALYIMLFSESKSLRPWVRDWVEQQKKSARKAVDQTAEQAGEGGNLSSRSLSQTTAWLGSLVDFSFLLFSSRAQPGPNVSPRLQAGRRLGGIKMTTRHRHMELISIYQPLLNDQSTKKHY